MSEPLVVDASVAIKWYLPEVHADVAIRCLDEKYNLLVPDLFLAEFGSILRKKCRIGEITHADALAIFDALGRVPIHNYRLKELMLPAFELATRMHRTIYVSIYLALAVSEKCKLLTADRKFYNAMSASPYSENIHWVEDDLSA
ncbi:MAG: type II toxin-antitoxin system VapC family toxin [Gammaproteobacteria bacterium]